MTAINWRDHLAVHPAAELFPLLSEPELKELAADIEANGLNTPIVMWSEKKSEKVWLLDGRNRLDALALLGELEFDQHGKAKKYLDRLYRYDGDPYALALSFNLHRRHLTAEQKRDVIAKLLKAKPEASNLSIAKQVMADDKTVASVRRDMESRSEIPNVERHTDSKGRKQPARKPRTSTAAAADTPEESEGDLVISGDDVEDAVTVLNNIIDSIKQAKSVAEAWRKILKASTFDREAKELIGTEIDLLIRKLRSVQSTISIEAMEVTP
jgi:hypothetical protein